MKKISQIGLAILAVVFFAGSALAGETVVRVNWGCTTQTIVGDDLGNFYFRQRINTNSPLPAQVEAISFFRSESGLQLKTTDGLFDYVRPVAEYEKTPSPSNKVLKLSLDDMKVILTKQDPKSLEINGQAFRRNHPDYMGKSVVTTLEKQVIKAPGGGGSVGGVGGKPQRFMGGMMMALNVLAVPVMVHQMLQESIIGWDCGEVEDSIDTLRCAWDSKLDPTNNKVYCDLYQEKIEGSEACGVGGVRFTFTVNDSESKDHLKKSSLMTDSGLKINPDLQQDPTGVILSTLMIFHIKYDGQIQYQPIQFTPAGGEYN